MKEYLICLEFRVAIRDLTNEKKKAKEAAIRQEAIEVHQKRLDGIKAAKEAKKLK